VNASNYSSGDGGVLNPHINLLIDAVEGSSQRTRWRRRMGQNGAEFWPEEMIVGPGEEQRNTETEAGQAIAMRVGNAFDEAV